MFRRTFARLLLLFVSFSLLRPVTPLFLTSGSFEDARPTLRPATVVAPILSDLPTLLSPYLPSRIHL